MRRTRRSPHVLRRVFRTRRRPRRRMSTLTFGSGKTAEEEPSRQRGMMSNAEVSMHYIQSLWDEFHIAVEYADEDLINHRTAAAMSTELSLIYERVRRLVAHGDTRFVGTTITEENRRRVRDEMVSLLRAYDEQPTGLS